MVSTKPQIPPTMTCQGFSEREGEMSCIAASSIHAFVPALDASHTGTDAWATAHRVSNMTPRPLQQRVFTIPANPADP
jgi:hypothetical protein